MIRFKVGFLYVFAVSLSLCSCALEASIEHSLTTHSHTNKNGPEHSRPKLRSNKEKNLAFSRKRRIGAVAESDGIAHDDYPKYRVAVLVAGGFLRYFLESSAKRLVAPLTRQMHSVDYYLSLTLEAAKPYRAAFGYTQRATWDPIFSRVCAQTDLDDSAMPNKTVITDTVRNVLTQAGAQLREFRLSQQIDVDTDNRVYKRHQELIARHPNEDPNLRFPTYDLGSDADHSSNIVANRNLLRLHLSMEYLWLAARKSEEYDGQLYHFVLFLRDDTKWLLDFDLNKLLAQGHADVYLPSCDARNPPLPPDEVNDHGLVVSRRAADNFGFYLDYLLNSTFDKCHDSWNHNLLPTLDSKDLNTMVKKNDFHALFYSRRGCNSEMILKWQLDLSQFKIRKVGQGLMPFQRSMHLNLSGNVVECFHKYCTSSKNSLGNYGMQRCSTINVLE